jgi:riboflavin biosynthesis pyrimidine reductase
VVVTASGDVDSAHPAIVKGAIVLTTSDGAKAIGHRLPKTSEVVTVGTGKRLDVGKAMVGLRSRGLEVVLTEGGPHLVGQLIEAGLLDEAFLTVSPVIAGRKDDKRLGMIEGVELLPGHGVWSGLSSIRRHGDYLFLRYRTRSA